MGSPILVGLSKSRRVKPGAAAQHYIVLYCIVFAALREERSRNVRSFELQLFRFDLCVNLINALGNPLLTVQYFVQERKDVWQMRAREVPEEGSRHLPADVACLHR